MTPGQGLPTRFILVSFLLALGSVVTGYSSGPPLSTCSSMTPGHGPSPQSNTAPYAIAVNASSYAPNDVIRGETKTVQYYRVKLN